MSRTVNLSKVFGGAIMLLASSGLFAQWPAYPTAGVPKTPDGKPNLTGPAPKTPDGKPDLSGIWKFVDSPDARPGTPPPAGARSPGIGVRIPGLLQFFDIGSTLKDGLPFQPWAAELRSQRVAENNKDNPDAQCLPIGLMQLHTHPEPRKDHPDSGIDRDFVRSELRRPPDLHGRAAIARQRRRALVVRLLHWKMGRRHAGGGDQRLP